LLIRRDLLLINREIRSSNHTSSQCRCDHGARSELLCAQPHDTSVSKRSFSPPTKPKDFTFDRHCSSKGHHFLWNTVCCRHVHSVFCTIIMFLGLGLRGTFTCE